MKSVCLLNLEQVAVLVPMATGVSFWNQTDAPGMSRQDMEGILVPVTNDAVEQSQLLSPRLRALFTEAGQVSSRNADEIDRLLLEISSTDNLRIDRQRLSDSRICWVWIHVQPQGDFSQFEGFEPFYGVLTWPYKFTGFS